MSDEKPRRPRFAITTLDELERVDPLTDDDRAELEMLSDEIGAAMMRSVGYQTRELKLSQAEIVERFEYPTSQASIQILKEKPARDITYSDIHTIARVDPVAAAEAYMGIKEIVRRHINGGHEAGDASGAKTPWERAKFLLIWESFLDEWKPSGGIEYALIDMLAQSYVGYLRWMKFTYDVSEYATSMIPNKAALGKTWEAPRLTHQEMLDHAAAMMDRFNRMFLRVLRQMRDLRRYSAPVTINNPQQVNIANEGGNQTNSNLQKKVARKKKAKKQSGAKHPGKIPLRIAGQK